MSFEKQICEKCKKISFCVNQNSLIETFAANMPYKWLCEACFAWTVGNAHQKDEVRQIMIECGIEDLE